MGTPTLAVTYSQIIGDFPEFKNLPWFTQSSFNYWSAFAYLMLSPTLYGSVYTQMVEQFIIHHMILEAIELGTVATNGIPGINTGAVSSESFGSMNISYNSDSVLNEKASHWNYTRYGVRFLLAARQFGAGPQSIGPAGGPGVTAYGGPPWFPW